jgi:uncharacterized repeat protein (TIGR01451 family)
MSAIRRRFVFLHLSLLSNLFFLLGLLLSPLTAGAANLTGLSLTPQNPTIAIGGSVQMTATGSYDDGTQQVIKQAKQVSAGASHTCAVNTDGTVQCWGNNNDGQLGNGTFTASSTPVTVSGINTAVAVSAGGSVLQSHTCATLADGTVQCWGYNGSGELGNGTTANSSTPVTVSGISTAVTVSAGPAHTCATLADGTLQCWGYNGYGQLGNGTTTSSSTPVTVSGISNAIAVSAGAYHTCATLADGTLRCWGYNAYGQLGNGTTTNSSVPVTVSGINTAVAVSVGIVGHSCAALTDGTVQCWGANNYGQLGNGTVTTNSSVPVTVSGISNAIVVSAGGYHTCATLADGTLRCWGSSATGQLGNGTTANSSTPVTVSGIDTAVTVSAGYGHTCATLADGTLQCWGDNGSGQLGNGTTTNNSSTPVTVSGLSAAVSVSAGSGHTCAALSDGTLRCWGDNSYGQLGDGTTTSSSSTPVTVSGLSNAVAVSAGGFHTCAVLADGTVRCWGSNGYGELGNGTTGFGSSTPVTVSGLNNAVAVSVGINHTCAVLTDGTLRCWGYNNLGFLGNGTTINSSTPVTVSGITNAVAVSASGSHTCAVLTDGTLQCWGSNYYGELGNGTTANSRTPVTVSGISNAASVAAGGDVFSSHTCATLADGTMRCWGLNDFGQLGNGTISFSSNPSPIIVSGISTAVAVSASGSHTCAVLSDGTLRCWGRNVYGELGNGTTTNSSTPVAVSGISTAVSVSAGGYHICATLADGTLKCWGYNYYGQLGNGMAGFYTTPVQTLGYPPLAWSSNTPSVATVDALGLVRAVAPGTALISASLGGFIASTTVTVQSNADLALTTFTDTPDPVLQGQTVTYNISVTNNGPSPATGVTVSGTLPSCSLGSIASGASASCTRTATATTVGTLTQTMTVSGIETDPNPANNSKSASTTVNPATAADLKLTLTDSPDPVNKGAKLTYTLTVKNNGPQTAHNVSLTDTLPANIIFIGVTKTQGSCHGTAKVSCALGTLNKGASAKVTITIKPMSTGTITDSASVSATEGDPTPGNNTASTTTLVKR